MSWLCTLWKAQNGRLPLDDSGWSQPRFISGLAASTAARQQLETEILENQRNRFAKAAAVSAVIFIAVFLLIANVELYMVLEVAIIVASLLPVVYTWMPLLGFQTKLMKARSQLDD